MKKLFVVSWAAVILTACGGGDGGKSNDELVTASSRPSVNSSSVISASQVSSSLSNSVTSSLSSLMQSSSSTPSSIASSSRASSRMSSSRASSRSSSSSSLVNSSSSQSSSLSSAWAISPVISTYTCVHEGNGKDYQVGNGKQYTSLADVPFENLNAGDTVRIFYRTEPYRNRIVIANAFGTAERPIRICGVLGPNGERPIIEGENAVTRQGLDLRGDGNLFVVGVTILAGETDRSEHVIIEGLNISSGRSDYSYTNENGATTNYSEAAACIRIQRGGHITIRNNELSDCDNGIFTGISDGGDNEKTSDLLIEGNYLHHNSSNTVFGVHNLYIQAIRVTIQFNYLDSLVERSGGANIKTRSIGNVIRYNFIKNGARLLDMVEAMDNPEDLKKPALQALYDVDYVYGNIIYNDISKLGENESPGSITHVHYGGDQWTAEIARQGTLWYYNNTIIDVGNFVRVRWYNDNTSGFSSLSGEGLQEFDAGCADYETLCTNVPTIQSFNNIHVQIRPDNYSQTYWNNRFSGGGGGTMFTEWYPLDLARHSNIDLRLGKNFYSWLPIATVLDDIDGLNTENLIIDSATPINLTTYQPITNSVIGKAVALPPELANYPVTFQYDPTTQQWEERLSNNDMGAVESD